MCCKAVWCVPGGLDEHLVLAAYELEVLGVQLGFLGLIVGDIGPCSRRRRGALQGGARTRQQGARRGSTPPRTVGRGLSWSLLGSTLAS